MNQAIATRADPQGAVGIGRSSSRAVTASEGDAPDEVALAVADCRQAARCSEPERCPVALSPSTTYASADPVSRDTAPCGPSSLGPVQHVVRTRPDAPATCRVERVDGGVGACPGRTRARTAHRATRPVRPRCRTRCCPRHPRRSRAVACPCNSGVSRTRRQRPCSRTSTPASDAPAHTRPRRSASTPWTSARVRPSVVPWVRTSESRRRLSPPPRVPIQMLPSRSSNSVMTAWSTRPSRAGIGLEATVLHAREPAPAAYPQVPVAIDEHRAEQRARHGRWRLGNRGDPFVEPHDGCRAREPESPPAAGQAP